MRKLVLLALVGLAAQLVDGSLGMGYGMTSSSLLLLAGLSPALASASVHLAEIGTTLASGASHWRLGNTDPRLVVRLGLPGAVGAFSGATVLSHLSTRAATPVTASLLILLGAYVLGRFALRPPRGSGSRRSPHGRRLLVPLGMVGGFVDATGGGGWGPVVTTTLLTGGRTAPRTVVGSVGASEFLVTAAASAGFLTGLGTAGISLGIVLALLAGGLVAAPIAAWLVSRLPGQVLGTAVGGLILATNLRVLLSWSGTPTMTGVAVYVALAAVWSVFMLLSVRRASAVARATREETGQVIAEVRSGQQHQETVETVVSSDEELTPAGSPSAPGEPTSVELARSRTRADLVVEPV
ncbi:sulfite exporter TauE/SafE family protein [uncultured Actinomyces sp.]|uniref:sulfite exporter TauE/SafE family protein n=1 Tax=uncultured Actinomyces sp. TaxID=249061 RepID=UPI0028D7B366|nr:sulfite exporter TauE/SafE family protein [uncultured Actinomyces sp.]